MHFFIKTLQNCGNQSFQEHSASMKICSHIDVESSARGHFVKKKILYFSETIHIVELFSQRQIEEPCKI